MGGLKTLYFDCFSGAAGDMILGALIDAGVPLDDVRGALGRLAIAPDTIWTERVTRAGVTATKFCVQGEDPPSHEHPPAPAASHRHGDATSHRHSDASSHQPAPATSHRHGDASPHTHRTLAEIGTLIDGSGLSPEGRERAKHLFHRLGSAEAAIHGMPLDKVHLHEVGALDSIIDVVGTVFALESLQVDRVVSSPLNVGGGTVRSAHGLYPVPAPATVRLLEGAPVYSGPQQVELLTPTGALLVTDYASAFGAIPAMHIHQVGYGAGTRDFAGMPNVLRVLIGDAGSDAPDHAVVVIEAEIDDMNPQIFGVLMDRLLGEGALDVFYTSIQMKKNRPGTLLTIVAPLAARERLTAIVFRESTTIGVRFRDMRRECLERETVVVDTPLGAIRFKVARRNGEVMNNAPEFEDCARLAAEHQRPVKEIQALALKAFLNR